MKIKIVIASLLWALSFAVLAQQGTVVTPGAVGANPTATAGGPAINGSATTFMRSDAAPASPKASPMYVAGAYYAQWYINSSGAGSTSAAGTVYFIPIFIGQPITIGSITLKFNTECANSGNVCTTAYGVGLYSASGNRPGSSNSLLAYGYSTSGISSNFSTVAFTNCYPGNGSCSSYSITTPGWYWLAFQYGDTTETIYGASGGTGAAYVPSQVMGSSTLANMTGVSPTCAVSVTGSAGTMPTSPSSFTEQSAGAYCPWLAINVASVP